MNDNLLFLAMTTLLGISCIAVGWIVRGIVRDETPADRMPSEWRDREPVDSV